MKKANSWSVLAIHHGKELAEGCHGRPFLGGLLQPTTQCSPPFETDVTVGCLSHDDVSIKLILLIYEKTHI